MSIDDAKLFTACTCTHPYGAHFVMNERGHETACSACGCRDFQPQPETTVADKLGAMRKYEPPTLTLVDDIERLEHFVFSELAALDAIPAPWVTNPQAFKPTRAYLLQLDRVCAAYRALVRAGGG